MDYYWILPEHKNVNKTDMQKNLIRGVDYFDLAQLKRYCRREFGRVSDGTIEDSPGGKESLYGMIKNKKRQLAVIQSSTPSLAIPLGRPPLHSGPVSVVDVPPTEDGEGPRDSVGSDLSTESKDYFCGGGGETGAVLPSAPGPKDDASSSSSQESEGNLVFDDATGSESNGKKKEEKKVIKAKRGRGRSVKHPESSIYSATPETPKQLQPPPLDSPSSCDSVGSGTSGNETLMTAQIAWRLLMRKYKFRSITRHYCLPGVSLNKDKGRYKEGRDYFKSLRELRGHLCAYGIPDDKEDMRYVVPSSEMESLERWIRLSVVDALTENMRRMPERDGMCRDC